MSTLASIQPVHAQHPASQGRHFPAVSAVESNRCRSVADLESAINQIMERTPSLSVAALGQFESNGVQRDIKRYTWIGPRGGGDPIRLGIFAGIHGDEPEGAHALVQLLGLLEARPELAAGYALSIYPICNPVGYEANARGTLACPDLNREFWRNSAEPEVRLLESELNTQSFDGLISLHSDDGSSGLYGFARGATMTRQLLRPALRAAAELLPVNQNEQIDGFHARNGLISDCYEGVLSAPPTRRRKPFEIILETPGKAPAYLQQFAAVFALQSILVEYRKFIAYAPNL